MDLCILKWKSVKTFSVISHDNYVAIKFGCLDQLEILQLERIELLQGFFNESFSISSLKTLELSSCLHAEVSDLKSQKFPNLTHLAVSDIEIDMDQAFIDALSMKSLEVLALRRSKIVLSFQDISKLCESLTTIIFQGSTVIDERPSEAWRRYDNCKMLQLADWSSTSHHTHGNNIWPCDYLYFPNLPSLLTAPVIYFDNIYQNPQRAVFACDNMPSSIQT